MITVRRFASDNKASLSIVEYKDRFVCFGLEDAAQKTKIPGKTRIPAGTYKIKVRTHGGYHKRYRNRFEFHNGMLEVCGVPNFTDILIHIGNFISDTAGCLLVANIANNSRDKKIGDSRRAYIKLYKMVIAQALAGDLTIQYIDED